MRRAIKNQAGKSTRILSRALAAVLALAMLTALFALPAVTAAEGDESSLQIRFHHQEESKRPIPGAKFQIFRVAEPDGEGGFRYTDDFADCGLAISRMQTPDDALMVTLAGYAQATGAEILGEGVTDETGRLNFRELPEGVYLIIGYPVAVEDTVYTPQPFALYLPAGESLTVEPKFTMEDVETTYLLRRVLKIWKDEGYEEARPQEITVLLLKDGEVYDRVTLNAANNWRAEWDKLPAGALYLIYEETKLENYTVLVEQQGVTFTVTNSYQPPDNPPPPDTPDNPPKLPQTGLLWWPVPLLMGGGAVLLLAGAVLLHGVKAAESARRKH